MAAGQGASLRELRNVRGHSSSCAALICQHVTQERDEARSELANVKMGANELHHENLRFTRELAEANEKIAGTVRDCADIVESVNAIEKARRSGK